MNGAGGHTFAQAALFNPLSQGRKILALTSLRLSSLRFLLSLLHGVSHTTARSVLRFGNSRIKVESLGTSSVGSQGHSDAQHDGQRHASILIDLITYESHTALYNLRAGEGLQQGFQNRGTQHITGLSSHNVFLLGHLTVAGCGLGALAPLRSHHRFVEFAFSYLKMTEGRDESCSFPHLVYIVYQIFWEKSNFCGERFWEKKETQK